jgi:hypothetical protein
MSDPARFTHGRWPALADTRTIERKPPLQEPLDELENERAKREGKRPDCVEGHPLGYFPSISSTMSPLFPDARTDVAQMSPCTARSR